MRQLNIRYLAICLLLSFGPLLSAQESDQSQVFQIKRSVQAQGPYESIEARSGAGTQSCECIAPVNGALLICDDFESYTEGEALTTQSNLWRLWPGANRDALVDRSGRNKYILLDHQGGTESDVLLDLGNVTSGTYELSFRLWTFSGTSGYFNIQHNSNFASNSQANWAYHVQFNNGAGLIRIGSFSSPISEGSFSYTPDSWNTVTQTFDLDNDIVQLTINGQLLGSWQFSAGSLIQEKRLGALNFFANDNFNARFAVDNVCFTQVDGVIEPKEPNLSCVNQGDIRVENADLSITGIQVENSGEGPAEATTLGFYLSTNTNFTVNDFLIATQAIPALEAGESYTFNFEMDLADANVPDGFYYLGYILDYPDAVAESDETDNNNCAWTNLRFQFITEERDPNLTCAAAGNFALQNQVLSISNLQIANNGNALASTTEIGVYLSADENILDTDFYLGDIVVPQMEPDTIIGLEFQADLSTFPELAGGDYFVGFIIDYQDKVDESNENDNNCVSASSFTYTPITPEPNLYCKESGFLLFDDLKVAISGLQIGNDGNIGTSAFKMGLFVSTDNSIDANDQLINEYEIPNVGAETFIQFTPTANLGNLELEPGTYYVGLVIDYENIVTESDETDNANCSWSNNSFTIEPPAPVCSCTNPVQEFICDDFESYNPGFLSLQSACFRTADGSQGSALDGMITTSSAYSGNQALQIRENGQTDALFLLGERTSGTFTLEWVMYIPSGKSARYTIQQAHDPGKAQLEITFGTIEPGVGYITAYNTAFRYPEDRWFRIKQVVNLDQNHISVYLHNQLIERRVPFFTSLGSVQFLSTDFGSTYNIDDFVFDPLFVVENTAPEFTHQWASPEVSNENAFTVFPNPASDVLQIKLGQVVGNRTQLILQNDLGQIVRSKQIPEGQVKAELDVAALPQGIYFIRMEQEGRQQIVKKVVIR